MSTNATTLTIPEGVKPSAWSKLAIESDGRWAIRERDASGEVIGTAYRTSDGNKGFEKGGSRGLIYPHPLGNYVGTSESEPICVCEGASDTAAMLGIGFDAVGIPMAGQCGKMLAELLKGRHVVIVSDNDGAGSNGTQKIAKELVSVCASVRLILPPGGVKDAREAIAKGACKQDFIDRINNSDSIPASSSVSPGNEFRWVSIVDIGPAAPPDWIWPGYIAGGAISLLTGYWKAGKTTLVLHLLRDLFKGNGLIDTPIEGHVLIVSEEGTSSWARRRDTLGLDSRIHFLERENFCKFKPRQWQSLIEDIIGKVAELNVSLVIFDTLASLWPVQNENDASEVQEMLAPLRGISETGAALLVLHHPRKNEGSNFTGSRGSGALPSFADVLIELKRTNKDDPKDRRRTLQAIGRYEDIPSDQVIELTDDGYVMRGEVQMATRENHLDCIESQLREQGKSITVEELMASLPDGGIGAKRARSLLNVGSTEGRWRRVGKGVKGDPYRYGIETDQEDSFPGPSLESDGNGMKSDLLDSTIKD